MNLIYKSYLKLLSRCLTRHSIVSVNFLGAYQNLINITVVSFFLRWLFLFIFLDLVHFLLLLDLLIDLINLHYVLPFLIHYAMIWVLTSITLFLMNQDLVSQASEWSSELLWEKLDLQRVELNRSNRLKSFNRNFSFFISAMYNIDFVWNI